MTNTINEQSLNCDNNDGLLNTPLLSSIDQNNSEDRTEMNLSNESILSNDLMEFFSDFPGFANQTLLEQRIERSQTDMEELKRSNLIIKKTLCRQKQSTRKIEETLCRQEQSIAKIQETLSRQEQSNEQILQILTQLVKSNNKNNQRLIRPPANTSEVQLGINERPISRSNQEIPVSTKSKFDQRHSTSDLSVNPVEGNRNQLGLTTTNELNSNGQLLYASDEIDKIRSEKNQKQNQIGQLCYEIHDETTEHVPALITVANPENSQKQRTKRMKRNPITSTSNLIDYKLSKQLTTTVNTETRKHTQLSLLHPLNEQINSKTDGRTTKLIDCFGNSPVLVVRGENLPKEIRLELAMIFSSENNWYYSMYQLLDENGKGKDFISRSIKIDNQPQQIELNNLKICKMRNSKQKKNDEVFILKEYPSDQMEDTGIDSSKVLDEQYHSKNIQLAIRCFANNILLTNVDIFYSNLLRGVPKIQSSQYKLKILKTHPSNNSISFHHNNPCQIGFSIEIPNAFNCTLISGYTWLEISLITNDKLNSIYSIDIGNGNKNNPVYFRIECSLFKMPLNIIKQTFIEFINNENICNRNQIEEQTSSSITFDILSMNNMNALLCINKLNCFCVQFRLLHSKVVPPQSSIKYYSNCEPEKSAEFKEVFSDTSHPPRHETVNNIGQKRTTCDSDLALPICKAPRL